MSDAEPASIEFRTTVAPMSTMPQWTVLYDASQEAPSGMIFLVIGGILFVIAVLRVWLHMRIDRAHASRSAPRGGRGAYRFLGFAAFWTLASALVIIPPHVQLVRALRAGRFVLVEGSVERYQPADLIRKRPETWEVAGHAYRLWHGRPGPGLDTPGWVRAGAHVRIADVGGAIARLEIER